MVSAERLVLSKIASFELGLNFHVGTTVNPNVLLICSFLFSLSHTMLVH